MARELAALWEVAASRICIASSSLSSVKYAPTANRRWMILLGSWVVSLEVEVKRQIQVQGC